MKREAWVVIGAMLLGVPLVAQGKPLTVTGVRGVTFGAVLPGVPRVILRTDPANSGQFDIKGPKGGPVLLSFVLPLSMTGPGGALMPIVFGARDVPVMRALGLAGVLAFASASLAAQGVMVAPHAVFIDHSQRSGSVLLYNPGTEPVEVTISTIFGYPTTDSAGGIKLDTLPADSAVSALAWIQAFPRRLTVGPRERQTVRLLARPPIEL